MARLRITADMLREKHACSEQVCIFEAEWPNGWTATKKNCLRAATLHLNLDWAATAFFTAPAQAAYEKAMAPAWAAYEKAMAPAWAAYEKAKAPASAAYEKAIATAWAAYEKAKAPARAAYEKAIAPAWAAYEKAMALAFWRAARL